MALVLGVLVKIKGKNNNIKNKNELACSNLEEHLKNWTLPKVKSSHVYNIGAFDLKSTTIIKTVERTILISEMYEVKTLKIIKKIIISYILDVFKLV